jgi:hypothetical protein
MNIVQHHTRLARPRLPYDIPEDHTCLGRRDFDRGFDTVEAVRGESVCRWALHEFNVPERGEFDAEVLERVVRLVYDQDVWQNVILRVRRLKDEELTKENIEPLNLDVRLCIYRIGKPSELHDATQVGQYTASAVRSAGRAANLELVLRTTGSIVATEETDEKRTSSKPSFAAFLANCLNVIKSSACTALFFVSFAFFSAAFFYQPKTLVSSFL